MTAMERVITTRRMLGAGAITHALAWGLAAGLGVLAAISIAAVAVPQLRTDAAWPVDFALTSGIMIAAVLLWRSRHFTSISRVALWVEELIPELQYSLVTAVEHGRTPFTVGMETTIARQDIAGATRKALRKRLVPALAAVVAAVALLYVSPSPAFGGGRILSRMTGSATGETVAAQSRLDDISVLVTPPAYAGQRSLSLDDPAAVTALAGSRITVRGDGSPTGVTAAIGGNASGVSGFDGGWTMALLMPAKPAALSLRDRAFERLIVLDPRSDNSPSVVLTSPARDTTLRIARLVIRLNAAATDDVGLNGGYFEYLVTTGSGEIFNARTITSPPVGFGGARAGSLAATLDLASLRLGQGDVVSIRAIVQDGNTLTGPGLATSDTRTFRIARGDEYDSVAVDAAGPLPADSSAMSQRMLIMMTEKLVREEKGLSRQELVRRSTEIGDLEDRVRKRVEEILFETEGGAEEAETPETGVAGPETHAHAEAEAGIRNPDLFEAYNALWEAVRSLQIAEPAPALPPMRVALKALDRARLANRFYLRGLQPKVIVDLARVRMTGKEKGSGSARTPRQPADFAQARLERRFGEAIDMIESRPADAVRAFTFLQVEALSTSPSFASALGEAIEAFRRGRDATNPLLRARRALSGDPAGTSGLSPWSGGW